MDFSGSLRAILDILRGSVKYSFRLYAFMEYIFGIIKRSVLATRNFGIARSLESSSFIYMH